MRQILFQDCASTSRWCQAARASVLLFPALLALLVASVGVYLFQASSRRDTLERGELRTVHFQRATLIDDLQDPVTDLSFLAHIVREMDPEDDSEGELREARDRVAAAFGRLITTHDRYDQVRWVGNDGWEIARVESGPAGPVRVTAPRNEKGRHYFDETVHLPIGAVYVSALERNAERGRLELPYEPTLRFATPLTDRSGRRHGILILNFRASRMLRRFAEVAPDGGEHTFLLDMEGDFLRSPDPGDDRSFHAPGRGSRSFAVPFRDEWLRIRDSARGQFETSRGLFTYATVRPIPFDLPAADANAVSREWKVVSLLDPPVLAAERRQSLGWILAGDVLVGLLMALATWRVAAASARRAAAEQRLLEEEAKVRGVVESATDAIITIDSHGTVMSINPAGSVMFQYRPHEIVGQNVRVLMNEEGSGNHNAYLSHYRHMRGKRSVGRLRDVYARRQDGSLLLVEISLSEFTVRGEKFFTAILRDVTDRKAVEQELRLAASAFETHDCIAITDADGTILRVNPSFTRITGFSAAEAVGQTPRIKKSGRHEPRFYEEMWEAILTDGYWDGEVWNKRKCGEEYREHLTITAVRDEDGRTTNYVAVGRDVTAERKAEAAVRQYASVLESLNEDLDRVNAELLTKNRELDDFTSVASHDLQEPLRKMTSFSDLLEQDLPGQLPEAAKADLDYIRDSARRMQRLIQDLLKLSRAGRAELDVESIPLDECVDAALQNLDVRIRESDAKVLRDPLPTRLGDRTLITLLFQNLIGNALKFVKDRRPVVQITCERIGGEVVIGVRDNGIGIQEDARERIFTPFRRLHGRGEYEGSGIGLAICRKAVLRHHGWIRVESSPGEGSHFLFTLSDPGSAAAREVSGAFEAVVAASESELARVQETASSRS
ncbi:PAS domain S-box protein [bacterium]|nr:PAS domain S-box protein [bacterium]